jgi:hypothetical protein
MLLLESQSLIKVQVFRTGAVPISLGVDQHEQRSETLKAEKDEARFVCPACPAC